VALSRTLQKNRSRQTTQTIEGACENMNNRAEGALIIFIRETERELLADILGHGSWKRVVELAEERGMKTNDRGKK